MPTLKASIKGLRQSKKREIINSRTRRRVREAVKVYNKEIAAGNVEVAAKELPRVYKLLDKAAKNGIIRKQSSSRRKSRLAKKLNVASSNVDTANQSA